MDTRILKIAGAAALATGLAACATYPAPGYPPTAGPAYSVVTPPQQQPYYGNTQAAAVEYGRITNVQLVSQGTSAANTNNNTAGTLLGGVVGGVLGNQIGHGGGRAAATILGAVGGAAVGNRLTNPPGGAYAQASGPVYRVWVQMDSGVTRTYDVSAIGDLHPGDRVRVENGAIYLS
ncbi:MULTISPECIES: glycine zipper 2TM domain-containing protein [Ramlibacter]|uniref:Glycine zipper 2TM domain-containing protein n=1 Tax=Ramlibacter aquaticus TaxID=2780094 RepID=A0ABR9SJG3_9BURK|nr:MULTISPECIES: glycine zipper 2TM domain-containing protein [Ramlibacter]MBE7942493.1 glycine zipper 2TM domain-containing protein [Ramlibacter aquaticus]